MEAKKIKSDLEYLISIAFIAGKYYGESIQYQTNSTLPKHDPKLLSVSKEWEKEAHAVKQKLVDALTIV